MSYVIQTVNPETETYYTIIELYACRVCLATETKLFNLHKLQLTQMFEDLTGTPVSPSDGLPQHICTICYTLLRKSAAFRAKCRQTHIFLQDARIKQPLITTEYISNIRDTLPNSTSKLFKTNTLVIGIPNTDGVNQEPVVIDDDTDHEEEVISPDIQESTQLYVPVNDNTDGNLHVFYPNTASKSQPVCFKMKQRSTDRPSPFKNNKRMSSYTDTSTHEGQISEHNINLHLIDNPLACQEFIINNEADLQGSTELTSENMNDDYDKIVLFTETNSDEELIEDASNLHEEFVIKEESY